MTGVHVWWVVLSTIGVINIAIWLLSVRALRGQPADPSGLRTWHVALCGAYVFVCAFRSFLPRADVQRICLVDSWWSTVLVGRSVATIGELCFMAQAALFLYELGKAANSKPVVAISKCIVPMIAFAETCSWYAVITTNYLGNTLEESTWTVSASLLLVGYALLYRTAAPSLRRVIIGAAVVIPAYVTFMLTVDVPMYFNRWRADEAAHRAYLSFKDGFTDLNTRWVVTFSWAEWKTEIPWMTAYFSAAVWISLTMMRRRLASVS